MKVGIIVDNPKRDLNGCTLLAYQLTKLGLSPYLIPMYYQISDVTQLDLDILVLNYIRKNNENLVRYYNGLGIKCIVMDTEGGILSENGLDSPSNWADFLVKEKLNELISHYTFWGRKVRDPFVDKNFLPPKKLTVTGCPRYDFCTEKWSPFLEFSSQGYILINTNFSAINPQFTTGEEDEKRIFKDLGWDSQYVDNFFEDNQIIFSNFLDEIEYFFKNVPNQKFWIRPHPFEKANIYVERFGHLNNVTISGEGDVFNVLSKAKAILHLNCGTSVESNLLGKPALCIDYINTEMQIAHTPLPRKVSYNLKSRDETIELLSDLEKLYSLYDFSKYLDPHILDWFHTNDGKASERLALVIKEESKTPKDKTFPSVPLKLSKGQKAQQILTNIIGSKLVSVTRAKTSQNRKSKFFTPKQINQKLKKIAQLDENSIEVCSAYAKKGIKTMSSIEIK